MASLAVQYVDIVLRGLSRVDSQLASLRAGLERTETAIEAMTDRMARIGRDMSGLAAGSARLLDLQQEMDRLIIRFGDASDAVVRMRAQIVRLESVQSSLSILAVVARAAGSAFTVLGQAAQSAYNVTASAFQGMGQTVKNGVQNGAAAVIALTDKINAMPVAIGLATTGFTMLARAVEGWVKSGLAGTTHGVALSMQFQDISRQIAGIFVPELNKLIGILRDVAMWFRHLTGEQQALIRRLLEAAAVVAAMGAIIKILTATVGVFVVSLVVGMITAAGSIMTTLVVAVKALVIVIATFVGNVIVGMAAVAASIFTTLIPAFLALVTAVVSGSSVMAAALGFATAGISLIIGAVAALASAFVGLSIGAIGAVVTGLAGLVGGATALAGALGTLGISAGAAGAMLGSGLVVGTVTGREALMQLVRAFVPVVDTIVQGVMSIGTQVSPIMEILGGRFAAFGVRFAAVMAALLGVSRPVFSQIGDIVIRLANQLTHMLNGINTGPILNFGTAVITVFRSILPAVEFVGAVFLGVIQLVGSLANRLMSSFSAGPVLAFGNRVLVVFYQIGNALLNLDFARAFNRAMPVVEHVGAAIMSVFRAVGTAISAIFDSGSNRNWFGSLLFVIDIVAAKITMLFDSMTDSGGITTAVNYIVRAFEGLASVISMVVDWTYFWIAGIVNGIDKTIGWADVLNGIVAIAGAIGAAFVMVGTVLTALVIYVLDLVGVLGRVARWLHIIRRVDEPRISIPSTVNGVPSGPAAAESFMDRLRRLLEVNNTAPGGTPANARPTAREDVMPAGGQFEQAMDLFRRINEAAIKGAADAEQARWRGVMEAATVEIAANTSPGPVQNALINPFGPGAWQDEYGNWQPAV